MKARALGTSGSAKPKGWLIGGYAGYNVEFGGAVVGVETDLNWSDIDARRSAARLGSVKYESEWAGATRGRVGFAFDRFLVYGAAGVAYAKREAKVRVVGVGSFKDDKTAVGWTVGGGVDAAVTENIIARVEYRYTDYGKDRLRFAGVGAKIDSDEHRIMGGLAYKFGW